MMSRPLVMVIGSPGKQFSRRGRGRSAMAVLLAANRGPLRCWLGATRQSAAVANFRKRAAVLSNPHVFAQDQPQVGPRENAPAGYATTLAERQQKRGRLACRLQKLEKEHPRRRQNRPRQGVTRGRTACDFTCSVIAAPTSSSSS